MHKDIMEPDVNTNACVKDTRNVIQALETVHLIPQIPQIRQLYVNLVSLR